MTVPLASWDWNLIVPTLVTGATASLVALFSWLGNHTTAAAAKHQREAEAARLHELRVEEHLQHRQGIYHDLLNAERRLIRAFADEKAGEEEKKRAFQDIYGPLNGAILFGTRDVGVAAVKFARVVADLSKLLDTRAEKRVLNEASHAWFAARRDLINAIRRDVSPDLGEIDVWPDAISDEPE